MGRQDNVEIFEDTQRLYSSNERLIDAIKHSGAAQECFTGTGRCWYGPEHRIYQNPAQTVISSKRTLEAAAPYAYAGKKVCILNFASATNPGGGVTKGSSAQEEAICRCSTLYANLKEQYAWNAFYAPHRRAHDPLHNDDCIYTPGVMVFKSDTDYPQLLPEEKWYSVNVLTCAAPNLRERPSNEMNAGVMGMPPCISAGKTCKSCMKNGCVGCWKSHGENEMRLSSLEPLAAVHSVTRRRLWRRQ